MSTKERRLGRGLDALLGGAAAVPETAPGGAAEGAVRMLPIARLVPGPYQPRRRFGEAEIAALAQSIRERGIVQPILARPDPAGGDSYQIVAGERRWRAAQRAQLHELPVIVRRLADREALEVALIENLQREDLTPLEEAEGYRRLIEEFGGTQEALALAVGRSRSHLANTLRLLGLPEAVKAMLDDRRLSAGHGRALLAAPDPAALARKVVAQGLNVRQTERLAQAAARPARARPTAKGADVLALERELSAALGLKVSIADSGGRGELRIAYRSLEQLDEVIRRLTRSPI